MNAWEHRAACRDADPDLFHPDTPGQTNHTAATRYCANCPVAADCTMALFAQPLHMWSGIWAGRHVKEWRATLDPRDRDADRARRLALMQRR